MDIDFKNLACQLLPPHKRHINRKHHINRLNWLSALLYPLTEKWTVFRIWRKETRMKVNLNGQTLVLENYLRAKYHTPNISIQNYKDGMIAIALASESEEQQIELHSSENESPLPEFPLSQEIQIQFDGVDFVVSIPPDFSDTQRADLEDDINQYKQALIKHMVEQGPEA